MENLDGQVGMYDPHNQPAAVESTAVDASEFTQAPVDGAVQIPVTDNSNALGEISWHSISIKIC